MWYIELFDTILGHSSRSQPKKKKKEKKNQIKQSNFYIDINESMSIEIEPITNWMSFVTDLSFFDRHNMPIICTNKMRNAHYYLRR